ncbi:multiple sugar transport system permease protein [Anaerotaenia torta]|uniref:carbohydrate ABC transporter permease n=1 Tax=Anaerotaenia torta TaxID=433293 RepID=UPI003D1E156F
MNKKEDRLTKIDYVNYIKMQKVAMKLNFRKNKISYLFIAPFYTIFSVFYIIPVVISIVLSFTYFNVLESPKFIGWQNYVNLFFADDVFLIAVKNTFLFAAITGPISYIASFLLAWLLNELPRKLRAIMVVVFYAPTLSGQVYVVWNVMFSGDVYGYINGLLMKSGLINSPIQWLTDANHITPVLVLVVLWTSMGAGFLSFVAGLKGIDKSIVEAGCVDGIKNRWQELWFITLPYMKPQLMFGAVMTITSSFAIHDKLAALAGFPSVDYAAHTIVSHLIDYGTIRYQMGYASAISTILFVTMIVCNKLVQFMLRKVGT